MQMIRLSYGKGVRPSVRRFVTQSHSVTLSKKMQTKMTKSSLSAPGKKLLPGSVTVFRKLDGGHHDRWR